MRFHWQNLNERRDGERTVRGTPTQGRCWLHFDGPWLDTIRFEWAFRWSLGAHVELDPDEVEITLSVAPLIGSFYLTFGRGRIVKWFLDRLLPWKLRKYDGREYRSYEGRSIGFHLTDWCLHFFLWANRDSWSSSDPKWKQFSINILDLILGPQRHALEILEPERDTLIPMPEGSYPAKVKLERRTWKRRHWPWWPFTRTHTTYDFEIEDGIPFPGKGENSWDCGDDGLFGCGFSVPNEAEAIGRVIGTVLHNRARRGGRESMLQPWREAPSDRSARLARLRDEVARDSVGDSKLRG